MKKKNSVCEFSTQRSELLLRNFRESIARQSVISTKRAFQESADMPAPRFWVSEVRATRIVTMLMKGDDATEGMHSEKRKMYLEIYRRVKEIKEIQPEKPLGDIVFEVVNSPAPCSYMKWGTAAKLIQSARGRVHSAENTVQRTRCREHSAENTEQRTRCREHGAECTVQKDNEIMN